MTKDKDLEAMATAMGLEFTPELREFAWAIKQRALIQFWKDATRQTEFQQEVLAKAMKAGVRDD